MNIFSEALAQGLLNCHPDRAQRVEGSHTAAGLRFLATVGMTFTRVFIGALQ